MPESLQERVRRQLKLLRPREGVRHHAEVQPLRLGPPHPIRRAVGAVCDRKHQGGDLRGVRAGAP